MQIVMEHLVQYLEVSFSKIFLALSKLTPASSRKEHCLEQQRSYEDVCDSQDCGITDDNQPKLSCAEEIE